MQFVRVVDRRAAVIGDRGFQDQQVVITGGPPVLHAELDNGDQDALPFEVAVAQAAVTQQLRAAHLEPDRVRRVMGHAHRVAFGVPDADFQMAGALGGVRNGHWCNR